MKQGLKSVLVVLLLFVGFTLGVGVGFFGITQGAGVVGAYAEEREAKAAAEKQAKEEEGLHTFSHNYGAVYASTDAYFQDLDAVGQVVKEQIGYVPSIIRFPGGASNTVSAKYCPGIMSSLVNMVHERGYEYYDWNASSADGGVVTADQAYQAAISQAQAGTKDIILLFHDSETKQTTVDALTAIIEYYKSQGYEFRPIKRGGFVYQHGVAN